MQNNILTYSVPPIKSNARRLAISDIHGCLRTFEALLEKVDYTKEDQLFLLGDFIDRGPDSAKLLDKVMQLEQHGYQVFCIRGNHEQMLLDNYGVLSATDLRRYTTYYHNHCLFDGKHRLIEKYKAWIERLPYYFDLGDYYLVHAGFDFGNDKPFEDKRSMLWVRRPALIKEQLNGRKVIHGHTPMDISYINRSIRAGDISICIDNGCAFEDIQGERGALLCLDLDTMEVHRQRNMDMRRFPLYRYG